MAFKGSPDSDHALLANADWSGQTLIGVATGEPDFLRITDFTQQAWIDWNSVPYCEITAGVVEDYRLPMEEFVIARKADPCHGCVIGEEQDAVLDSVSPA